MIIFLGEKSLHRTSLLDPRCIVYPHGGDVRDIDTLNDAMKGCDAVIHLAAMWPHLRIFLVPLFMLTLKAHSMSWKLVLKIILSVWYIPLRPRFMGMPPRSSDDRTPPLIIRIFLWSD